MRRRLPSLRRRVLVVLVVAAMVSAGCSGDGSDSAAAAQVEVFLARDALGDRAFADVEIAAISEARLVELAGVTRIGSASGAFVAVDGACDVAALFEQLTVSDDRLAAWSAAAGVDSDDALTFLTSLTPAVSVEDVVVTLSFYDGGTASSEATAQLQAGTAVLVDDTGEPRVRCRSGQPMRSSPVAPSAAPDLWADATTDEQGVVAASTPSTETTSSALPTTTTAAPGRTSSTSSAPSTTDESALGTTIPPSTSTTIAASTSTTIAAATSSTIAASTSSTIAPPTTPSTSTTIPRGSNSSVTTEAPVVSTTAARGTGDGAPPSATTAPPERGTGGGGAPPVSTEPPGRGNG